MGSMAGLRLCVGEIESEGSSRALGLGVPENRGSIPETLFPGKTEDLQLLYNHTILSARQT